MVLFTIMTKLRSCIACAQNHVDTSIARSRRSLNQDVSQDTGAKVTVVFDNKSAVESDEAFHVFQPSLNRAKTSDVVSERFCYSKTDSFWPRTRVIEPIDVVLIILVPGSARLVENKQFQPRRGRIKYTLSFLSFKLFYYLQYNRLAYFDSKTDRA